MSKDTYFSQTTFVLYEQISIYAKVYIFTCYLRDNGQNFAISICLKRYQGLIYIIFGYYN